MEDDYLERDERRRQPPWYLLTGLLLGLGLGLLISLVISPVTYKDTAPAALAEEYKADYRLSIARVYQANLDIERASQRIALLQDAAPVESLAAQAQQALSAGNEQAARALASLASALSDLSAKPPASTPAASSTPGTAPGATVTPEAAASPSPPTDGPFVIVDRQQVCDAAQTPGLLQIEVRDSNGTPVPGIQINVAWDGGLDTFFTGLKPAISAGYADFQMTPGVSYSLRVGDGGATLNGLSAPECVDSNGNTFSGGLYLVFGK
ncbi:MAG TPA: hypothetical protein DCP32_10565 [Anaerolineaceae bacterium]|nr:MAG: hypothetical protein A2X24_13000 [Chloroflexi bacterium GWB2_54_36]HAL17162.1 hypothetical protein [Anaerolineaceae bacterium]